MKLTTIGGLTVSALLIAAPFGAASAADMPLKAPIVAPAAIVGPAVISVRRLAPAHIIQTISSLLRRRREKGASAVFMAARPAAIIRLDNSSSASRVKVLGRA